MWKIVFGSSWTKIGTVLTILSVILSMPQLGEIIPKSLAPYLVIALNAVMYAKRTFCPAETITSMTRDPRP